MNRNNLRFAFEVVLFVSVMVLYVLYFMGRHEEGQPPPKRTITDSSSQEFEASMVFVNIDSLLARYEFSKDLNKEFGGKRDKIREEFRGRAEAFQKDAAAFQDKVQRNAFLSQASAESQEAELMQRQQELEGMQSGLAEQLMAEQEVMNKRLYDSVTLFIQEFNKSYGYHFIFSSSVGGNILYGDERLDITDTIVQVLNQRYARSQRKP